MINKVENAVYAPILKLKLGELKALGSLPAQVAHLTLPVFDVPPGDIWDWENLRLITASEHLKTFGSRLHAHRGSLPVFIDVSHIEEAAGSASLDVHPMTALTERARQAGAQAFPALSFRSTDKCLEAANNFLARNPEASWLLRVRLVDLDKPNLSGRIEDLLRKIERTPETGVLIIDGHTNGAFTAELASLVQDRVNEFPYLMSWANLFYASTSFPDKRKIIPNTVGRYSRDDRKFFRSYFMESSDLLRSIRYADYGVEFPSKFAKGGGAPRAHLRFSSPENYLISEGVTTKGNGFAAIGPVARLLEKQPEFRSATDTSGKRHVQALAERKTNGSPTSWRWSATEHHIRETVLEALADEGIAVVGERESESAEQLELL